MPDSWDWVGIGGLVLAALAFARTLVRDRDDDSKRVRGEGARLRAQGRDKQKLAAAEVSAELLAEIRDQVRDELAPTMKAIRDALVPQIQQPSELPAVEPPNSSAARSAVQVLEKEFRLPPSGVAFADVDMRAELTVIPKDEQRPPSAGHHTPADFD